MAWSLRKVEGIQTLDVPQGLLAFDAYLMSRKMMMTSACQTQ